MKLYTRTGDSGETSLYGGERVSKADPRVQAYGDLDELNAWLGFVRASEVDPDLHETLTRVQRNLLAVSSQLADPAERLSPSLERAVVRDDDVAWLEQVIDRAETEIPRLERFILAGGVPTAAALHVARTVCRRAERSMVALDPAPDGVLLRYVNRLSDALFVLARVINHRAGLPDTPW